MNYRFYTCDVFTDTLFGGNPLAVLPEAQGLSDGQMQQIAREFNFSESAFVLPAERGHDCRVRIFTPMTELPFAGHPNIGTAFVLATIGVFGSVEAGLTVTFEEKAGPVPIAIHRRQGTVVCELSAPERLSVCQTVPVESVAAAVSLGASEILTTSHLPQVASVGVPFLMTELKNRAALARARVDGQAFEALGGTVPDLRIHLYTRSGDDFDIRARMFDPLGGVLEDPATGSANCALAGLLRHYGDPADGTLTWRIAQGVEMGRPSVLQASADRVGGTVLTTRVGGASVMVADGHLVIG
jgi:trans-2,3-dihydro-3-hydroxyanthranilate isomerase